MATGVGYDSTATMKALECKPRPCWPKCAHCNTTPTILLLLAGSHTQLLARTWYMVCKLVALNTIITGQSVLLIMCSGFNLFGLKLESGYHKTVQYTSPSYISLIWKDMKGGVVYRTVWCYHPYLVSLLFDDLLSLHLVTFLTFFFCVLFMSLLLAAGACLSWSLPSISKQHIWPSGDFLVWHFHDAFSRHWECCLS